MDIGFIGLGKMGFPMARHLIEAKHRLVVLDPRKEAVDAMVALGAEVAKAMMTPWSSCGASSLLVAP